MGRLRGNAGCELPLAASSVAPPPRFQYPAVDAYSAAIPFYEKNGFVACNTDDEDDITRVLYFDLMDLKD